MLNQIAWSDLRDNYRTMNRQDFRFFHRLRVRWAEVDMQKIVFNGHYLMYFDTAMADYWRALAIPYEETMHALGGDLYVKKASVEYHASARYDDMLDVGLKCTRIGNSSIIFTGGIFQGDQMLVTGELIYVYANPTTQSSQPVPQALRQLLQDYEAGKSVTRVVVGDWTSLQQDARAVRTEVFVTEQKIPMQMEWDDADQGAVHAVIYNNLGLALATGRLLQHAPNVGRIGRMASKRVLRGAYLGSAVLDALTTQARARGDKELLLHAQRSAEGFYAKAGFRPRGEPFDEVGIAHLEMVKPL
jgi:YbgC/YbaW family acyl-CoA thioester hydrolase